MEAVTADWAGGGFGRCFPTKNDFEEVFAKRYQAVVVALRGVIARPAACPGGQILRGHYTSEEGTVHNVFRVSRIILAGLLWRSRSWRQELLILACSDRKSTRLNSSHIPLFR